MALSARKLNGHVGEKSISSFDKLNFFVSKAPLPIHIVMAALLASQLTIGYAAVEKIIENYKNRVSEIAFNNKEKKIVECGEGFFQFYCKEVTEVEYNHPSKFSSIEETISKYRKSRFKIKRTIGIIYSDNTKEEIHGFSHYIKTLENKYPEVKGKIQTSFDYNIKKEELVQIENLLRTLGYKGEMDINSLRDFILKVNIFSENVSENTRQEFYRLYGKMHGGYDLKEIYKYDSDYVNFLFILFFTSLIPTLLIYFKGLPKLGKNKLIKKLPNEELDYMVNQGYDSKTEEKFNHIRMFLGMESFNEFKKLNGYLISLPEKTTIDTNPLGKDFIFTKNENGTWDVKNGHIDNITHFLEALGINRNNIEDFVKFS